MLITWVIKNFAFTEHSNYAVRQCKKNGVTGKPFTGNL